MPRYRAGGAGALWGAAGAVLDLLLDASLIVFRDQLAVAHAVVDGSYLPAVELFGLLYEPAELAGLLPNLCVRMGFPLWISVPALENI